VPRGDLRDAAGATEYIKEHHTYDARAADVLVHFDRLQEAHRRTGALRVAILWNGAWTPQLQTSVAAAADRLQRLYSIFWVRVADVLSERVDLLHYDVIFAVGARDSPADRCARALTQEYTLPRHVEQRRVWVLVDDGDDARDGPSCFPERTPRAASQAYDAVVFAERGDRPRLLDEGFHRARPASVHFNLAAFRRHRADTRYDNYFRAALQLQEGYGVEPFPPRTIDDDDDAAYDAVVLTDAREITTEAGRARVMRAALRVQNALVAVVGETVGVSAVAHLKRALGSVDMRLVGNDAIAAGGVLDRAARTCATLVVPHANASRGGDWAVAYAAGVAREGATVLITDGAHTRLHRLAATTSGGVSTLSDALAFGVTRALTLGRGASKATIVNATPSVITRGDVRFALEFEAFVTGRDGSWCLVANTLGMLTCVLQRHLELVLRVEAPENCPEFDVAFHVELKSNVYGDVLRRSNTVSVRVGGGGDEAAAAAYSRTEVLLWPFRPACPSAAASAA